MVWLGSQAISTKHSAVYATVSITIDDVNDNAPSFVGAPYKGTIVENSSPGTTVLRVTAVDADQVIEDLHTSEAAKPIRLAPLLNVPVSTHRLVTCCYRTPVIHAD